jgi:radical SAM protein with 4Fe4S-binding SPASM domain
MTDIYLRKEEFGGVLFAETSGRVRYFSEYDYNLTEKIARGLTNNEIVCRLKEEGKKINNPSAIVEDLDRIRKELKRHAKWGGYGKSNKDESPELRIPTLSAPLDLHWEVTGKCQLKCKHCYNESGEKQAHPPLSKIVSVISELEKYKLRSVVLSGGEPLLRRDILEIIKAIRPITNELVLATNAAISNEHIIGEISQLIDAVNISVDSAEASVFDGFRGVDGTFEQTLKGLRSFVKHGVTVVAQTVIFKENVEKLDLLANLLLNEGVRYWSVRMPVRSGYCNDNTEEFMDIEQSIKYEDEFQALKKKYSKSFDRIDIGNSFTWSHCTKFKYQVNHDQIVSCAAGTIKATLRSDGRLVPCPLFSGTNFASNPVWEGNFINEWRESDCMNKMRNIRLRNISPCNTCGHIDDCSLGCRAKAYLSGDLEGCDPDCMFGRINNNSAFI